ncbi:hypothetical protein M3936_12625 [Sutcliffiella horikoshii]|uniref:hypothetical protein n=1 Tax=Sutcliffiella horikoshii TaxID=79883 RepID=UPI0020422D13|nr:hypothetical protein [Sutcliffiella horikoshii]MCM3618427.1 hypothetical protein [Sutcliffiella horikoshii]
MKEPIRIMLLGIAILIVSIFVQNIHTGGTESVSNPVQIIFAIGVITTLVGYFKK